VNIIGLIVTLITSPSLFLVKDGRFLNPLGESIYEHEKEVLTTLFISILVAVISGYISIWCEKRKNS
jgi:hypothetical protein